MAEALSGPAPGGGSNLHGPPRRFGVLLPRGLRTRRNGRWFATGPPPRVAAARPRNNNNKRNNKNATMLRNRSVHPPASHERKGFALAPRVVSWKKKREKKKRCRPDPVARERRTPDRPGGDRNPPLPPVRSIRRSRAEPFAHAQTKKSSAGCCGRVRQNRSCCARSKAPLPLPTRGVPKTIFGCGHPCRSRRRQPGEQRTVPKGHSPRQDGTARTGKFRRTTGKEEVTTRPLSALKRRIFSASNSSSSHSNSSRQYIRHQIDCANRAQ
mmetsp:Transcript_19353/g.39748  ORF Transcript_19353/g.39748 Transcript_19353/m.39748 type:complete len:269 (-) Transcript_19353:62-868(-)